MYFSLFFFFCRGLGDGNKIHGILSTKNIPLRYYFYYFSFECMYSFKVNAYLYLIKIFRNYIHLTSIPDCYIY